jgi:putative ABC transport system substrate-binding protein
MRICLRRREFIGGLGGAAAWPLAAGAQQRGGVRRVGMLSAGVEVDPVSVTFVKLMREELQKLGWTEGRNLQLEVRFGAGDINQTRAYAVELVKLAPDVIVSLGAVTRVVQEETRVIPIVFAAGDVIENEIVRSVARPEGHSTGFTIAFASLGGKWLELLKDAAPTRACFSFPEPKASTCLQSRQPRNP